MRLITLSEKEIIITLIALGLLLLSAFICGTIIEKIKGPRVVGEIIGGMLIGGSCMFLLFPEMSERIFFAYPEEGKVLNVFYQLGLIFLMFLSGYNTDIKVDRSNAKTISLVFAGATLIPMAGSIPFMGMFRDRFIGSIGNELSYQMVFAIGVAITSIPVISKIFFDMGIMNTTFSNTVLTVSTFQDLCLWVLLNVATRIARSGEIRLGEMIIIVVVTIGIFAVLVIASHFIRQIKNEWKPNTFYTLSFVMLLMMCGFLYMIGINIMYSAFVAGYLIKAIFGTEEKIRTRMHFLENVSFSFFIPIYFALVGIQLNVVNDFSLARFLVFFAIAFGLEFIGTWLLLIPSGLKMSTRMNFAITMNARGGPGIVLATVAYSYDIISLEFFTVLILTTMLSSMIAGYYLRWQQKKDPKVFDVL